MRGFAKVIFANKAAQAGLSSAEALPPRCKSGDSRKYCGVQALSDFEGESSFDAALVRRSYFHATEKLGDLRRHICTF
jgi:hypothetical protein